MSEYHNSPEDMAKCLITYMASDEAVQREVEANFVSAPPLHVIRNLRTSYNRQREIMRDFARRPIDRSQTDKDNLYANKMARLAEQFADRIIAEGRHA